MSDIIERKEQEKLKERYVYAVYSIDSANSEEQYKCLVETFEELKDYKDSKQLKEECLKKYKALQLENIQNSNQKRICLEEKKKRLTKIVSILISSIAFCVIFVVLLNTLIIPNARYSKAVTEYNNGQYKNAYNAFLELGNYKDAKEYSNEIISKNSKELLNSFNVGNFFYLVHMEMKLLNGVCLKKMVIKFFS